MKNLLENRSKVLLVSFILGALYLIYLVSYFSNASTENLGGAIATALVTPHMIAVAIAVIFNGIGFYNNKRGFVLTGAILYAVAMVLFFPYFMFVIIQMVLSFVGYSNLPK